MKRLARTSVYWPNIDADIVDVGRRCTMCAEHQNSPHKAPPHPWILPEKPWSRLHIDHAVSFMGHHWLVVTDSYSKHPCIHCTSSLSSKATIALLEEDFSHFGYPHSIVSDNAQTFASDEFQQFCNDRDIVHLTGAPYHPATNGAAERLIQTFKKALRKSDKPPKEALLDFLFQFRRTPTSSGFSPSELLNRRQLRAKIETLVPSPTNLSQAKQTKIRDSTKKQTHKFQVGDPCYALYFGPRRTKDPRWVPAVVVKSSGSRNFHVRVVPRGPIWRRHLEQLQPRYSSSEDDDPAERPSTNQTVSESERSLSDDADSTSSQPSSSQWLDTPDDSSLEDTAASPSPTYTRERPRRSQRQRKPPDFYVA